MHPAPALSCRLACEAELSGLSSLGPRTAPCAWDNNRMPKKRKGLFQVMAMPPMCRPLGLAVLAWAERLLLCEQGLAVRVALGLGGKSGFSPSAPLCFELELACEGHVQCMGGDIGIEPSQHQAHRSPCGLACAICLASQGASPMAGDSAPGFVFAPSAVP